MIKKLSIAKEAPLVIGLIFLKIKPSAVFFSNFNKQTNYDVIHFPKKHQISMTSLSFLIPEANFLNFLKIFRRLRKKINYSFSFTLSREIQIHFCAKNRKKCNLLLNYISSCFLFVFWSSISLSNMKSTKVHTPWN